VLLVLVFVYTGNTFNNRLHNKDYVIGLCCELTRTDDFIQ
jgi:hypothetical protein